MEPNQEFRNLVTNEYMRDFDYGKGFSFQTVFYKTAYSYCCCPCGYEHEYMDYISDTGEINEETYDKIVKSISDGRCPHADDVPAEWLKWTRINGLQIALAVGSEQAVKKHLDVDLSETSLSETGLYKLNIFAIAMIKNNYEHANFYYRSVALHHNFHTKFIDRHFVLKPCRSIRVQSYIKLTEVSHLEACVEKRDITLLKSILRESLDLLIVHDTIGEAFKYTVKNDLPELQDALLEYIELIKVLPVSLVLCIRSAIMYNQSRSLEKLMKYISSKTTDRRLRCTISAPCTLLKRPNCKDVLSKYGLFQQEVFQQEELSASNQIGELLLLLELFHEDFKDEIVTALKLIPNIKETAINYLQLCANSNAEKPHLVEIIIELGVYEENAKSAFDTIKLCDMKRVNVYDNSVRDIIKLVLSKNPDLRLIEEMLQLAIMEDAVLPWEDLILRIKGADFPSLSRNSRPCPREYQMDAVEHGIFGFDHVQDTNNFALNFIVPFLMECGVPVERKTLLKALEEPLHPAEVAYIKDYLCKPKMLTVACRETLRKHFKGCSLHHFLENSGCPQKLKDIVLLKQLLQCQKQDWKNIKRFSKIVLTTRLGAY